MKDRRKTLGIINGIWFPFDEHSIEKGCGGSETWAIQIADEFTRQGFHVVIYGYIGERHTSESGVEYVPISSMYSEFEWRKFDYMIISRLIENFIYKIQEYGCCDKVFVQAHDTIVHFHINRNGSTVWLDCDKHRSGFELPVFKGIAILSDIHQKCITHTCKTPPSTKYFQIPNGIDQSLFDNYDAPRDHRILWSSSWNRGLECLVNDIAPLVKKQIPDFGVDVCGYDESTPQSVKENPDINFLGKLSKKDLYKEMGKHAAWFYPCVWQETFCITALESVMCGNAVVSTFKDGLATTFDIFKGSVGMKHEFQGYWDGDPKDRMKNEEYAAAVKEAADMITGAIQNYDSDENKKTRDIMRAYILKYYTWERVVKDWISQFNAAD